MDKLKKRNGEIVDFNSTKIRNAIMKANIRVADEPMSDDDFDFLTQKVIKKLEKEGGIPDVEHIQDIVERTLQKAGYTRTAKAYILYRAEHAKMREMRDTLPEIFSNLTFAAAKDIDMKRENANINTDTAMGTMLKFGTESAKDYFDKYIIPPHIAEADINGDIHIHDKDFYTLTETCCQIDLLKLFKNGFSTGHGYLREPNSIRSYAALACIAIQSNQNEMHGGQAVPNFDYAMAEGVRKTYAKAFMKHLTEQIEDTGSALLSYDKTKETYYDVIYNKIKAIYESIPKPKMADKDSDHFSKEELDAFTTNGISLDEINHSTCAKRAYRDTVNETHQAMEAVIHNLNSMHCLPYSSLIYAYDTENKTFDAYPIGHITETFKPEKWLVLSINKKGHIEFKPIYAAQRMDNKRNLVTLTTENGQSVTVTTNHKVMALTAKGNITSKLPDKTDILLQPVDTINIDTLLTDANTHETLEPVNNFETPLAQFNNEIASVKIKDRKYSNSGDEYVYDISVKDNENFMTAEGIFVHNSRAGAQVPFSSINYGTDTSPEGQLVIDEILTATEEGLGNGETPIFPVQIFKVKEGTNYNPEDPSYHLFKKAMRVSAKRLFPNFSFMDAPFNKQYLGNHPDKPYYDEVGYMGCEEYAETVTYKICEKLYVEGIGRAWDRLAKIKTPQTTGISEFIDLTNENVTIYDTSNNGFVPVKKWIKNPNKNNWNRVKLSNGRHLVATDDHPLPVKNKGRTCIKDLTIHDQIPITHKQYAETTHTPEFSTEIAWLLGIILCDASYASNIMISIGPDETDIETQIKKVVSDIGFTTHTIHQNRGKKGNYLDVNLKCGLQLKPFRDWLTQWFEGKQKIKRHIPNEVFTWPNEYKAAFIAGMMDADGYINNNHRTSQIGTATLGSTNKELALQQMALLQSLGIPANNLVNHYKKNSKNVRIAVNFGMTDEIIEHMHSQKKIDVYENTTPVNITTPDYAFVNSIERIEFDEPSYDVETESDRFDTSGILSHNCRTRVMANKYDPDNEITPGRGNLSFTSINLPRIALESRILDDSGNQVGVDMEKFFKLFDERIDLCIEQLLHRFKIQSSKHAYNYPFLMGEGVWINSEKLKPTDTIGEVLKHGTLSIGFIGLAETLKVLTGKHHGESQESWEVGYKIIKHLRTRCDEKTDTLKLNITALGTPAEGLSGNFVRKDQKKYGLIPGVTDREYYTNSFHVPVYYPISAFEKIKKEAPFHELTNAGHISYVEVDGDIAKNIDAFEAIIRCMKESGIGYGSVNHPVDRDPICGYVGIINDTCPRCGRHESEAISLEKLNELKTKYRNMPDITKYIE